MSTLFYPLTVRSVQPDTAEAAIVNFEVPDDLREQFAFTQGQYLTLRAEIDGQDLRRSYSICSGVDDGQLRVGVRRVDGGAFSSWVHAQLKAGDQIQVMPPQGRFFIPVEPAAQRQYLAIAGGSGITPILSIIKTVLAREPGSSFTLLYGNRSLQSTMFKEELDDLKNRYLTRLVLHHVFSREETEAPLNMGRMNQAKVMQLLETVVPVKALDAVFVCGPYQMNDEVEAALLAAGVPQEHIHIERFGVLPSAGGQAPARHAQEVEAAQITLIRDGLTRSFPFKSAHGNLLQAAEAAGLEVPYSCTSGVCGTCRAKCLEGEVAMERNFALNAQEAAQGFVLTCQCHPLSSHVVLSFDER
ncbi:MAG: phenylacetate-CoA oxygenase/reductase subunit PaaK [Comamonas sp.]|jgi:ring-1,2-phenylacetyl-CoA epoxidase subunit PaaE|uniref:1,2-phenylacetyl-CoA epoxidase subunit PaaE n=1 Tax=Comamonas sp. TaxID=34028 RepID=UPI002826F475|nr:1,2-phenylacetyl-CoA epoxidase subunit PaaE [Comamonas sp.]MDR0213328.1 phenylacetate-CoA oxygenase/reductase subunit PaaK [Comamonas sp.]